MTEIDNDPLGVVHDRNDIKLRLLALS